MKNFHYKDNKITYWLMAAAVLGIAAIVSLGFTDNWPFTLKLLLLLTGIFLLAYIGIRDEENEKYRIRYNMKAMSSPVIIENESQAKKYINALRDDLIEVYTDAFSTSFKKSVYETRADIDAILRDYIKQRPGWKVGEKEDSFTYMGKHTFFMEPVRFSIKGLGWMPIETAKNIVRWELEESVLAQSEKEKTKIITASLDYVEHTDWVYPFIRRKITSTPLSEKEHQRMANEHAQATTDGLNTLASKRLSQKELEAMAQQEAEETVRALNSLADEPESDK